VREKTLQTSKSVKKEGEEVPVPEGLHPMEGTHAGAVLEELHPVGKTHVGEVYGELSPMRGTSRWSREECEESSS